MGPDVKLNANVLTDVVPVALVHSAAMMARGFRRIWNGGARGSLTGSALDASVLLVAAAFGSVTCGVWECDLLHRDGCEQEPADVACRRFEARLAQAQARGDRYHAEDDIREVGVASGTDLVRRSSRRSARAK